MYLRESKRKNRDGSVVSYPQLAHNERHPHTWNPVAKAVYSFGRAETVDREAVVTLTTTDGHVTQRTRPEEHPGRSGTH